MDIERFRDLGIGKLVEGPSSLSSEEGGSGVGLCSFVQWCPKYLGVGSGSTDPEWGSSSVGGDLT